MHFCDTGKACNSCVPSPLSSSPYLLVIFKINRILEKTFSESTDISPCPLFVIFGVPLNYPEITKKKLKVLSFATLITHKCILLQWKLSKPPADWSWQTDVMLFLKLEKVEFSLRETTKKFNLAWQPIRSYFVKVSIVPVAYECTYSSFCIQM